MCVCGEIGDKADDQPVFYHRMSGVAWGWIEEMAKGIIMRGELKKTEQVFNPV